MRALFLLPSNNSSLSYTSSSFTSVLDHSHLHVNILFSKVKKTLSWSHLSFTACTFVSYCIKTPKKSWCHPGRPFTHYCTETALVKANDDFLLLSPVDRSSKMQTEHYCWHSDSGGHTFCLEFPHMTVSGFFLLSRCWFFLTPFAFSSLLLGLSLNVGLIVNPGLTPWSSSQYTHFLGDLTLSYDLKYWLYTDDTKVYLSPNLETCISNEPTLTYLEV